MIRDLADNSRIEGTYAVSCYRQALDELPEDLLIYSNAADEITRALLQTIRADASLPPAPQAEPSAQSGPELGGAGGPAAEPAGQATPLRARPAERRAPQTSPENVLRSGVDNLKENGLSAVPLPVLAVFAVAGLYLIAGLVGRARRRRLAR